MFHTFDLIIWQFLRLIRMLHSSEERGNAVCLFCSISKGTKNVIWLTVRHIKLLTVRKRRAHIWLLCVMVLRSVMASDQSCTVRYGKLTNCVVFELKKTGLYEYQSRFHLYHYILLMLNDLNTCTSTVFNFVYKMHSFLNELYLYFTQV